MRRRTDDGVLRARDFSLCVRDCVDVILLNSVSDRFPNGLGNDSGELGHNLMVTI